MIYLETERLVLRDWREEDSVVFSRMNRDPKVMEYFLKPLTDTESRDFYERIRREIDTFGWGLFAAEVKISGKFIGYIGLHHTNFETDFCKRSDCKKSGSSIIRWSLPDIRCSGMYFIGLKKGKTASSIMISQSLIRILTGT